MVRGRGYERYAIDVEEEGQDKPNWSWDVSVPRIQGTSNNSKLGIRCSDGFFQAHLEELNELFFWIFDCKQGGIGNANKVWSSTKYKRAMELLLRWMKDIPRWSVVFLSLPGLSFDAEMRRMLKIPQDCHTIKGMWKFEDETKGKCEEDLVYGGHVVGAMEVLGDVGILLNYPSGLPQWQTFL
jgi:hypothetical protein